MEKEKIFKHILDNINQIILVSDFETHQILYANDSFVKNSLHPDEPYENFPCYKYMMNFDSPCPFCPASKMGDKAFDEVEVSNGKQFFLIKTQIIEWEGRKAFIEYSRDITADKLIRDVGSSKEVKIINALSSSYQNVYLIDIKTKMLEIIKLEGYVTVGLDKNKQTLYPYDDACSSYISRRVYKDDIQLVTDYMKWETVLKESSEKEYYEFSYRVLENDEIHFYQGRYKLVDENFIVCGFQNIDSVVKEEEKQKKTLEEAKNLAEKHNKELAEQLDIIKTVSKSFNSIYYVNMRDFSFIELGTNIEGVQEIIGSKGDARASFELMYKHLVSPDYVESIKEFTNLYTLDERLKDRQWITCQFLGTANGWSEGLFVAANRNADGKCEHVIWATRNIDETKRKEIEYQEALKKATVAAEAANIAKTKFLFNMSHDIRTPMNAIIGFTDLLEKNHTNPEKCYDYMEKIRFSSDILLALINNVLEMARIESGKSTLDETCFRAGEIQEEISSVYSELFKTKNITFTRSANVKTKYIYGDVVKIKEIFLNIISNSYKYTPDGGKISIDTIEMESDKPGYAKMQTTFTDTGIGMSKEFLSVIFDEFSREHNETEDGVKGTGLGMAIVKKLIEMMGGTITIDSELGKGTKTTIVLTHKIGEAPDDSANPVENINKNKFVGKRILLAEDNALNAEIAIAILSDLGFEVEWAADGIICVDMFQKAAAGYYDLILMDIQMPNMDGYKASKIIRDIPDSEKNQIPIVAMTANAFEEDKKDALNAGMNVHLAKPIVLQDLMKTLSDILE